MLHAIKHAHDHAMHHYTLQRLNIAQHKLSLAYGGAADVPGTTGTRAAWPRIVSRCAHDVRALNIAYAGAYAGMRGREGANAPVAGAFAAHVHMAPGRTRQGQRTRTRTCFRPSWLSSMPPRAPVAETWTASIERTV